MGDGGRVWLSSAAFAKVAALPRAGTQEGEEEGRRVHVMQSVLTWLTDLVHLIAKLCLSMLWDKRVYFFELERGREGEGAEKSWLDNGQNLLLLAAHAFALESATLNTPLPASLPE